MGQITRTCSLIALGLAGVAASTAGARTIDVSPYSAYVQARVADTAGESDYALLAYAAAMTAAPGNDLIALRAYREAVEGGDKALALRAARQLQLGDALPVDARLLLIIDAVSVSDWSRAQLLIDQMDGQGGYDFLVPVLRAWAQFGSRRGDPVATLKAVSPGSLSGSYSIEHLAYLRLALGEGAEGASSLKAFGPADARIVPARLAAAAKLVADKNKAAALDLLTGGDPAISRARAEVEAGRPLAGAITTPSRGIAAILARVAGDLMRDRVSPVALTLSRLSRMADPKSDYGALVEAQALAANERNAPALTGFRGISDASPYRDDAIGGQIALLQKMGLFDEAIKMAQLRLSVPDAALLDYVRLGEIYARAQRHTEAASAFKNAIDFGAGVDGLANVPWALWLYYGGSLERSGDWALARTALQQAVKLAPEQAGPLNHLGYSMLERREDVPEAMRLITRASALRPDDAAITDSLGWAYFLQGETAKAISLLERAVELDQTEPTLSEHLGDAYWAAGRHVDARYAWRAARVQSEKPDDHSRLDHKIDFGVTKSTAAR